MKTIGIVAHSAEGGALCFLTACREGAVHLGPYMHPTIVVSAVPMGLSMTGWQTEDHATVARFLSQGVRQVADAGADFYVCPDNTAHIVLEQIASSLPIPGLHIADVVCREISAKGWKRAGLLGTKWTMTGTVYTDALARRGLEPTVPDASMRERLNRAIFEELCHGIFRPETTRLFQEAIDDLASKGAECVILGCTEIPLIITSDNSSLPVLDSTRLLAKHAVLEALNDRPISITSGWLTERSMNDRRIDVFFYGLFMDVTILRKAGAAPIDPRQAYVDGFQLRIGQRATIVPAAGARVHGMIFAMTQAEIESLYAAPGLELYRPEKVIARPVEGAPIPAVSYVLPGAPRPEERDQEYAERLRRLLEKLGFPEDYVASV
jgi:aspartate racemase